MKWIQVIALTVSFGGSMVAEAAPISVYGVGYKRTSGLPAELFRFSENGPMEERWDILDSRHGTTLATDGENLYVGEFTRAIQRYSLNGDYLGEFANVGAVAGPSSGTQHLETDAAGNVYVAVGGFDSDPRTSFRLDGEGNISQEFSHPSLVFPTGIDAAANGDVYIVNGAGTGVGNRLFRFDSNGQYLADFSIPETLHPSDIAIHETTNELYIADDTGEAIDVYDISGGLPIFLDTLLTPGRTGDVFIEPTSGRIFGTHYEAGIDDTGLFIRSTGFEVSRDGNLIASYVEAAIPGDQNVRSIVAVMVPEPASSQLLLITAICLYLRGRQENKFR